MLLIIINILPMRLDVIVEFHLLKVESIVKQVEKLSLPKPKFVNGKEPHKIVN